MKQTDILERIRIFIESQQSFDFILERLFGRANA